MSTCLPCGAHLESEWKYCIHCGAMVASASTPRPSAREGSGLAVPSAIRPETAAIAPATMLDVRLLIGIVLGLAGAALLVYIAIQLFGPK